MNLDEFIERINRENTNSVKLNKYETTIWMPNMVYCDNAYSSLLQS